MLKYLSRYIFRPILNFDAIQIDFFSTNSGVVSEYGRQFPKDISSMKIGRQGKVIAVRLLLNSKNRCSIQGEN